MSAPVAVPRTQWKVVAFAIFAGIFAAMELGKVPPAMPALGIELAVGLAALGWAASIFNAVGAALGIPAGALSDGLGHRRVLISGFFLIALGSLLGGLTNSFIYLLITRLLEGVGYLGVIVSAPSLVIEATAPKDHGLALGLWSTFLPIGFAFMVVISPSLIDSIGWHGLWFANAALMAGYLALFMIGTRNLADLPNRQHGPSTVRLGEAFGVVGRAGPLLLTLAFVVYTLQWSGLSSWMPTFLKAQGYDLTTASLLSALVIFINAPGNVLGSWLLRRGVARSTLIAAGVFVTGVLAIGIFSDFVGRDAKLALALVFSLLGGVVPPAVFASIPGQAPSPAHLGAVTGFVMQGNNIGFLFGAPIIGTIVEVAGGWSGTGWFVLAIGILGVVLATAFHRFEKSAATAAE